MLRLQAGIIRMVAGSIPAVCFLCTYSSVVERSIADLLLCLALYVMPFNFVLFAFQVLFFSLFALLHTNLRK